MISKALHKLYSIIPNQLKRQSRKVFFLGAGASVDAGYPLTSDLYKTLESDHKNSINVMDRESWEKFSSTIETMKKNYPEFSDCNNIEYLMTILSLSQRFHEGKSIPTSIKDVKERIEEFTNSSKTASTYEKAKNCFARCIESTFAQMDYEMGESSLLYLKNFFKSELSSGNTIITTNYDLVSERCVQKLNLWNVHDGYGFDVHFRDKDPVLKRENKNAQLNLYNSKKSKIKILKLHGSVGWLNDGNKIVIDTSSIQRHISTYWEDQNYTPDKYDDKHLILPDFLKSSENQTMTNIWAQAQQALLDAKEVHFIGFSLPEYDANIRTLILPIRNKVQNDDCKVKVYLLEGDDENKKRWESHLSDKIDIISIKTLRAYCEARYK